MFLPPELLAQVFSYLPLYDRYSAALVCTLWADTMSYPSVWYYTEVRCEAPHDDQALRHFSHLFPMVKRLKVIICRLQEAADRELAVRVLGMAQRVRGLSVVCRGDPPLFYAGEDVLRAVEDLLEGQAPLCELDLRRVPFTLSDRLLCKVARHNPDLQRLFINNQTLVCNVSADTVLQLLDSCPRLHALGVFYSSLSEKVLSSLLLPLRPAFLYLELFCQRSDKYIPAISDALWASLRRRHPSLSVSMVLNHNVPAKKVLKILQPQIPVRELELLTYNYMVNELNFVASSYSGSLEKLVLQTTSSPALDSALVTLAGCCGRLKEVHCYCVVSQGVVQAFLSHCPNLWRYTLKIHKEPHPWTCTVLN